MQTLWQDLRYGARMLLKQPGFTLIAVLTLALGIGANTAIFTLINASFLRPFPVVEPERIVSLSGTTRDGSLRPFSYPAYRDYRDRNTVLDGLIANFYLPRLSLSLQDRNQHVSGYLVTGNYFDVLGVKAALGRTFAPEEDRAQLTHPVVVISHGCWQRQFGGDPNVIGQETVINNHGFKIIGVLPAGFHGLTLLYDPEIWLPAMMLVGSANSMFETIRKRLVSLPWLSNSGKYFWLARIVRIRHSCGTARNSASNSPT